MRLERWAVLALCGTLLAGCGTRVSHDEVAAESGSPKVSLDPASIAALRAAASSSGAAPTQPGTTTLAAVAPAPVVAAAPAVATVERPAQRHAPTRAAVAAPAARSAVVPTLGATTAPVASLAACTGPLAPVPIGQVGTFSGVVGAITSSSRGALAAWVRDVNSRGGLACHPVQLFAVDDGADPARAGAAVQSLTQQHHVIALVDDIITFSVAGFVPAIESAKVPAVGGDMIAPEWDQSPWMFPQGAGIDDQVIGAVRAGVAAGHKKLGFIYCVEVAECGRGDKMLHSSGAAAAGADFVYDSPIALTQPDYTAQCLNAKNAGVDLLGLGMDGASMVRLARSCAAVGYRPLLATGAATFSLQNTEDPNLREFGMISESAVAPWISDDTPELRAFHSALARYAPQLPPDGETVIAWSSGRMLEAAINHLSAAQRAGALTSELVVEGLGKLHDETLGGLTSRLTFTAGEQHATSSGCIYILRLNKSGWTAPQGSHPVCR